VGAIPPRTLACTRALRSACGSRNFLLNIKRDGEPSDPVCADMHRTDKSAIPKRKGGARQVAAAHSLRVLTALFWVSDATIESFYPPG